MLSSPWCNYCWPCCGAAAAALPIAAVTAAAAAVVAAAADVHALIAALLLPCCCPAAALLLPCCCPAAASDVPAADPLLLPSAGVRLGPRGRRHHPEHLLRRLCGAAASRRLHGLHHRGSTRPTHRLVHLVPGHCAGARHGLQPPHTCLLQVCRGGVGECSSGACRRGKRLWCVQPPHTCLFASGRDHVCKIPLR